MTKINRELVVRKGQLVIPQELIDRIYGNKRRRLSVVITDPRSRHVIITRYPENYKTWYVHSLTRGMDFIPTVVLEKAKIEENATFTADINDGAASYYGDLIIRRAK